MGATGQMTSEDRAKYYEKHKEEKKARNVLVGDDSCQTIYKMDNPGYTDTWWGNYIQFECVRCGMEKVPMVFFDGSCDEYNPVSLCANCLDIILAELKKAS